MKKIVLVLLLGFIGCVEPVLQKDEFTVVDTVEVNRNGFNQILSYKVVIKVHEDSSLHYGVINLSGMLTDITFKKIKNYYK